MDDYIWITHTFLQTLYILVHDIKIYITHTFDIRKTCTLTLLMIFDYLWYIKKYRLHTYVCNNSCVRLHIIMNQFFIQVRVPPESCASRFKPERYISCYMVSFDITTLNSPCSHAIQLKLFEHCGGGWYQYQYTNLHSWLLRKPGTNWMQSQIGFETLLPTGVNINKLHLQIKEILCYSCGHKKWLV